MLLALETSDRFCAACLIDGSGTIVAVRSEDLGRGHAERLMGMIEAVLNDASSGYGALRSVAVCVGPGSFTGIRVALATATGLSIALKIPVIGVSALQALAIECAARAGGKNIVSIIDAHRGDVYIQTFGPDASPLDTPRQVSIEDALAVPELQAACLVGNGAPMLAAIAPDLEVLPTINQGIAHVEAIARAAQNSGLTVAAKPLYLRRPDAKPQEAYTIARALR